MNKFLRSTGSVAVAVCALLAGCRPNPTSSVCSLGQPVVIPSSDTSSPTVLADLILPNAPIFKMTQANLKNLSTSNGYVVINAKATDPDGVKDIQIWAAQRVCRLGGGLVACTGPGIRTAPSASNPDSGAVGATGCTERATSQKLHVYRNASEEVSYEVSVKGINFDNKEATLGIFWVRPQ